MSLGAGGLAVNFAPAGSPALQPATVRSVKMTPFCATNTSGPAVWSGCAGDKIWDETARRYGGDLAEPGDTAEETQGRLAMTQMIAMSAAQGASSIVRSDGGTLDAAAPMSDSQLRAAFVQAKRAGSTAKAITEFVL